MSRPRPLFLFSLPRSGSTLVQRMLGAHPAVSTCSEPWILLPYLYTLRNEGVFAEYSHSTSVRAIEGFSQQLPNGQQDYRQAIRDLVLDLYEKASAPGARYFLDKTPRYSLVADDILRLFPDGRFLVLWRNPLAVLASIVDTWFQGRWMPYLRKVDLFAGLANLVDLVSQHPSRIVTLRYEDLVADPTVEMKRLLEAFDLPWHPGVVSDFSNVTLADHVGDRFGSHRYRTVSGQPLEKWRETLAPPVRRYWCHRYLRWIGRDRLNVMGYDLDDLKAQLDELPTRVTRVGSDLVWIGRGVAWNLTEPRIVRDKLSRFPHWDRIASHT